MTVNGLVFQHPKPVAKGLNRKLAGPRHRRIGSRKHVPKKRTTFDTNLRKLPSLAMHARGPLCIGDCLKMAIVPGSRYASDHDAGPSLSLGIQTVQRR